MRTIEYRLVKLEQARDVSRKEWRAFGTEAEAKADTKPVPPGTMVVRIVTGVPRWSDTQEAPT